MSSVRTCVDCGSEFIGNDEQCIECKTQPMNLVSEPMSSPVQPGKPFHGLEILGLAGKGGMGVVYKARQPNLNRLVALKVLPPERALASEFQIRFEQEARAMAALAHTHIVTIHDFGKEEDFYFFVMEYVDGMNLSEVLQERKYTRKEAVQIILQICKALEYAHGENIIHRDIKPSNVMIDKKERIKITDFGLAKLTGPAGSSLLLTQSGMALGTAHYMAPEQVENSKDVDHRADLYSVGVIFYQLLTGELPIGRFGPPSEKGGKDPRLDSIVLKALEKDPKNRYQNIRDLRLDIEQATTTLPPSIHTKTGLPEVKFEPPPLSATAAKAGNPPPAVPISPKPDRRALAWQLPIVFTVFLAAFIAMPFVMHRSPPHTPGNAAPPRPSDTGTGKERTQEHTLPKDTPNPDDPVEIAVFQKILFETYEGPLGQFTDRESPHLPNNPFLAEDHHGLQLLQDHLASMGLKVSLADLQGGYSSRWEKDEFLALYTRKGEELIRQVERLKGIAHLWSHREGDLVLIAYGTDPEGRSGFVDLVRQIQEKIDMPFNEPEFRLENLLLHQVDPGKDWSVKLQPLLTRDEATKKEFIRVQQSFQELKPDQIRTAFHAVWVRKSDKGEVHLAAVEFEDFQIADEHEERLRTEPSEDGETRKRIFRVMETIAVLSTDSPEQEILDELTQILERRMPPPVSDFERLHPDPEGFPKFFGEVILVHTGSPEVLRHLKLDISTEIVQNAFYVQMKSDSEILILEIEDEQALRSVKDRLKNKGEIISKGRYLYRIASNNPDLKKKLQAYMKQRFDDLEESPK